MKKRLSERYLSQRGPQNWRARMSSLNVISLYSCCIRRYQVLEDTMAEIPIGRRLDSHLDLPPIVVPQVMRHW